MSYLASYHLATLDGGMLCCLNVAKVITIIRVLTVGIIVGLIAFINLYQRHCICPAAVKFAGGNSLTDTFFNGEPPIEGLVGKTRPFLDQSLVTDASVYDRLVVCFLKGALRQGLLDAELERCDTMFGKAFRVVKAK